MYYTNISNEELQQFHQTVKITANYNELNTAVFNTSQANKLLPMFYCDTIEGNENLTILDDLLVLYLNNTDLSSLYFHSEEPNKKFALLHEIVTVNSKTFLKLHFYDTTSLFNVANLEFTLTQTVDNTTTTTNATTDMYGNYIIELQSNTGTFTVIGNNQNITWEET